MKVGKWISIMLGLIALSLIGIGAKLDQTAKREEDAIPVEQIKQELIQLYKANYQIKATDSKDQIPNHTIKVTLRSLEENHHVDISSFTKKYPCDLDHTYVLIEPKENESLYYPYLSCSIVE